MIAPRNVILATTKHVVLPGSLEHHVSKPRFVKNLTRLLLTGSQVVLHRFIDWKIGVVLIYLSFFENDYERLMLIIRSDQPGSVNHLHLEYY
jgi:hypothetical protein